MFLLHSFLCKHSIYQKHVHLNWLETFHWDWLLVISGFVCSLVHFKKGFQVRDQGKRGKAFWRAGDFGEVTGTSNYSVCIYQDDCFCISVILLCGPSALCEIHFPSLTAATRSLRQFGKKEMEVCEWHSPPCSAHRNTPVTDATRCLFHTENDNFQVSKLHCWNKKLLLQTYS